MSTNGFANMIAVDKAADIIGCTTRRVQQLLSSGTLKGVRLHKNAWLVNEQSARAYSRIDQGRGRPRKNSK